MFERFTQSARRVVVHAQEAARNLSHDHIGTEHLLLGIISDDGATAHGVLSRMGISPAAVRELTAETVGPGAGPPAGHIPFTPRAKQVMELSLREALQMGHHAIGPEHLLLGVLREGEGVGATVLRRLGATVDEARRIVAELSETGPPVAEVEEVAVPLIGFSSGDEGSAIVSEVVEPHPWLVAAALALLLPLAMVVAVVAPRPPTGLGRAAVIVLAAGVIQASLGTGLWLVAYRRPWTRLGRIGPGMALTGLGWFAAAAALFLIDAAIA